MRETQAQRQIVVPGEMRRGRTEAPLKRRSTAARNTTSLGRIWQGVTAAAAWLLDTSLTKPAETAGTLVVLGASGYILVNALGFQEGRHPAPILPQVKQVAAKDVRPVTKPVVRHEPSERPKAEATAAEPKPLASDGDAQKSASAALAHLVEETTASVTPKADRAVQQAQQALTKLGYGPLKDDGVIGPGTRAAIEKFERDHKIAVTGEAAGRTLKELAARAARKH